MGYFSNGTEGGIYFEDYCCRCEHDTNEDCPVWSAHLLYAYNGSEDAKHILDMLIPRSKDGLENKQCLMFMARPAEGDLFAAEPANA